MRAHRVALRRLKSGDDEFRFQLNRSALGEYVYDRLGFVETGRPRAHKIAMRYTAP
ncbi:hypothetical protein OG738_34050 [Amycolatopsis sp. NBC_01488]|uniref:hypothetical protein n=1 Tax=Amycolatopsis sp. NBC_01488 TaxID=2903563 RepID=UPI002E27B5C2|nr:hypothetical protein [Amycolatopsis sp. NBC_01488]